MQRAARRGDEARWTEKGQVLTAADHHGQYKTADQQTLSRRATGHAEALSTTQSDGLLIGAAARGAMAAPEGPRADGGPVEGASGLDVRLVSAPPFRAAAVQMHVSLLEKLEGGER